MVSGQLVKRDQDESHEKRAESQKSVEAARLSGVVVEDGRQMMVPRLVQTNTEKNVLSRLACVHADDRDPDFRVRVNQPSNKCNTFCFHKLEASVTIWKPKRTTLMPIQATQQNCNVQILEQVGFKPGERAPWKSKRLD